MAASISPLNTRTSNQSLAEHQLFKFKSRLQVWWCSASSEDHVSLIHLCCGFVACQPLEENAFEFSYSHLQTGDGPVAHSFALRSAGDHLKAIGCGRMQENYRRVKDTELQNATFPEWPYGSFFSTIYSHFVFVFFTLTYLQLLIRSLVRRRRWESGCKLTAARHPPEQNRPGRWFQWPTSQAPTPWTAARIPNIRITSIKQHCHFPEIR